MISQILQAFRGKEARDIETLSKVISDFSKVIANIEDDISEVDLNPIMVFDKGQGVKIADSLITFAN